MVSTVILLHGQEHLPAKTLPPPSHLSTHPTGKTSHLSIGGLCDTSAWAVFPEFSTEYSSSMPWPDHVVWPTRVPAVWPEILEAALARMQRHLWYLCSELVILAGTDDFISLDEKQLMDVQDCKNASWRWAERFCHTCDTVITVGELLTSERQTSTMFSSIHKHLHRNKWIHYQKARTFVKRCHFFLLTYGTVGNFGGLLVSAKLKRVHSTPILTFPAIILPFKSANCMFCSNRIWAVCNKNSQLCWG